MSLRGPLDRRLLPELLRRSEATTGDYETYNYPRLHNYAEVRGYLEKERPDWLRVWTPRHINEPALQW